MHGLPLSLPDLSLQYSSAAAAATNAAAKAHTARTMLQILALKLGHGLSLQLLRAAGFAADVVLGTCAGWAGLAGYGRFRHE